MFAHVVTTVTLAPRLVPECKYWVKEELLIAVANITFINE